jgi:nucleoside-diphosphate-sugar epimerase
MKVLLTGATGYVGHQLALKLASKDIIVHALVRDINSIKIPKHKNIIVFHGDVCNYQSIESAIHECLFVFHTAAYTNLKCKDIDVFYQTNVVGTENLLKAALKNKIKKVIYTSSLSVYGPSHKDVPITEFQPRIVSYANDYELTKSMSEEKVKAYRKKGLSCIVLNVSKIYGPGLKTYSNGVNKLISMFMEKDFLVVPNKLNVTSNYVFVEDVVNAHLLAMESTVESGNYIIGGENISYKELFNTIKILTESKIRIFKINYLFLKFSFSIVNMVNSILGLVPVITSRVLDSLFVNRLSTSDKAKRELKYKATSLNQGLQETIIHLKQAS